MVTDRLRPLRIEGRVLHQVWMPYHFGASGLVTGDSANDLFGISMDPNVLIQESKAGTCDVRPGRRPTGPALLDYVADYQRRAGVHDDHQVPFVTAGPGQQAHGGGEPSPGGSGEGARGGASDGRDTGRPGTGIA